MAGLVLADPVLIGLFGGIVAAVESRRRNGNRKHADILRKIFIQVIPDFFRGLRRLKTELGHLPPGMYESFSPDKKPDQQKCHQHAELREDDGCCHKWITFPRSPFHIPGELLSVPW